MELDQAISGACQSVSLVGSLRRSETSEPELEEVDRLIEKRAAQRQDADEQEESWRESVRQYHAEHREARRHQWVAFYRQLAKNHAGLAAHFEEKADALRLL